ncbi:hypothetical protein VTK73DRAFT_147 [Phialemonium thermophilum]|uniref:Uncharacterized protein n=1 Tax=Phialemonium thermophilum TaxID=223376 RepID=A0ABR3XFT1_9PEZI
MSSKVSQHRNNTNIFRIQQTLQVRRHRLSLPLLDRRPRSVRAPPSSNERRRGMWLRPAYLVRGHTLDATEDACVDVQHKKRGRPRLREDRDPKAESSRVGSSREASVRGPSFLYRPGSSSIIGYEESTTRNQSQPYRALQSQTNEGPEKREGVPEGHLNMLPAPLSISTGAPEPVAFLTTDLEIARASATFLDALAWPSLNGAKLADVVVPGDRDKVLGHQRQLQEEQRTREPTYLPPIFGKQEEDRVIQSLGFGPDELSRYGLERQDFLTFTGRDGHARSFPVRMGLAKQGSIYFVVLSLSLAARHSHYPTPSPNPRDIAYSYQPAAQAYSQRTPVSATFDPRQNRLGEVSYGVRRAGGLESTHQTVSPGAPAAYATSPSRPEYPVAQPQPPSYPLPPVPVPVGGRPPQSSSYQLPPIRSQQQQADPATQNVSLQSREERARVDIGGLIDPSNHPTEPKP